MLLDEATRQQLITKSKNSVKGTERYKRRNKSSISNSVKTYNEIDMNKLFKDNILTVKIPVRGETDDYLVTISFGGFLDILQRNLKHNDYKLELRLIIRSLIECFNKDNIYIGCSCPDFHYRFGYYATKNQLTSIDPETRPSDITNPTDSLGSGCKHVLLVLNNTRWIIKLASVINNYIHYMEKHYQKSYADIIYPAVYGKKYEEPVQLSMDDSNELSTDTDTLDTSNEYGRTRTQFKQGNTQGIRFDSNSDSEQIDISEN